MGNIEKTIWEKLQFLNEQDTKNGTTLLQISPHLVRADKVKQGGHVTMGVAPETIHDIVLSGKNVALLLLVIDKDAFDKA